MAQMISQGALLFWILVLSVLALLGFRKGLRRRRKDLIKVGSRSRSIGFLHPHCLSGGGGERVLWCAVQAMKQQFPTSYIVIYAAWNDAGVEVSEALQESRKRVRAQFGLDLSDVDFQAVDVSKAARLVDADRYQRLTLLLQALGSIRLGAKAYTKQPVEIVIDTANQSFALVIPKLMGAQTMSYVHYPTISTDMIGVVRSRKKQFNNDDSISSSRLKTLLKMVYYRMFAGLYRLAAHCVDVKVANSSWTASHLLELWKGRIHRVFPPCAIEKNIEGGKRDRNMIVSVGQFRPEKNHGLQLEMMRWIERKHKHVKCELIMIGGARNEEDVRRAEGIRKEAEKDGLAVQVLVNVSREELRRTLAKGSVGVHTMKDEHFGISVVELQACGLVVVAHRSGGVAKDIVRDGKSGILVETAEQYADAVARLLGNDEEAKRMRKCGLESCRRFADTVFRERFAQVVTKNLRV